MNDGISMHLPWIGSKPTNKPTGTRTIFGSLTGTVWNRRMVWGRDDAVFETILLRPPETTMTHGHCALGADITLQYRQWLTITHNRL